MDRIRIFISSPGDVADERQRSLAVVQNLQEEFSDTLSLEPLLWEQEPLLATADFQSQIRSPADFDIFITIIGSRLGSPLGQQFTRRDGTPYASGTEFEFEMAIAGHHATGRPELLFYRKSVPADQPPTAQLEKVSAFFDKWFPAGEERGAIGDYCSFDAPEQFEELLSGQLRECLQRFLPRPNNLPAPISSFLGRIDLMREIAGLLRDTDTRVVNLTGADGTGKSRLGLRTVRGLLADFRDGVFLVNLAYSREAEFLPRAIASALDIECDAGQSPLGSLVQNLCDRELLLLIDNLPPGEWAEELAALIAGCPGLKVLATGPEPLEVSGAKTISVPPMPLPDLESAAFADIRDSEGIQLFVERAQAVRQDFELTEENAREVLDICHQLGGLPLAIERAASRMRSMNTAKMLRSLASIKVKDDSGQTVYLIPR